MAIRTYWPYSGKTDLGDCWFTQIFGDDGELAGAYAQDEGENWVEDGTVINDTILHELLYVPGRTDAWGKRG